MCIRDRLYTSFCRLSFYYFKESPMGLMEGKTALVFGVANDRSIAWGITQALHREGATVGLSYAGEVLEKRVKPLAKELGITFVEQCDVTKDTELDTLFAKAKETFGKIDVLIHAVAFANREDLEAGFADTSRAGFHLAMDISVYSPVSYTHLRAHETDSYLV